MPPNQAYCISISGTVQGVGFRPFLFRLAKSLDVVGTVRNTSRGLLLHVEGPQPALATFLRRLQLEGPEGALIETLDVHTAVPVREHSFEIVASEPGPFTAPSISPDLATCAACLAEMWDAKDRRSRYPFITCTDCGPRYTISNDIPYDRGTTTMNAFVMCEPCSSEYGSPSDRRFHAQANACSVCGPALSISVASASQEIRQGRILALKGIGGFQLMVDARNEAGVQRLRQRKARDAKPLAIMAPSLESIAGYCHVSDAEERMLRSPSAPIVLLRRRAQGDLAKSIADNSPFFGMMLPYSPLHHLLMRECGFPVVATSGNISGEPIAIDNSEAQRRLGAVADRFLLHNRPIARPSDDSVVRLQGGKPIVIRRARGFVPKPIRIADRLPKILAVGGHLKNTVAIALEDEIVVSQHVGDLDAPETRCAFERTIEDLCRFFRFKPDAVACDLHPDYASSLWARSCGLPVIEVQHHHAHVAACAGENQLAEPYLGVAWDGTGLGTDGTIWGGEFFRVQDGRYERVAYLRPFALPGGEAAVRQGWRIALAMKWLLHWDEEIDPLFARMLERQINSPQTTSVGRLFDAVAAILGVAEESRFEGEAAMRLELTAEGAAESTCYPFGAEDEGDWMPLLEAIRSDQKNGVGASAMAARFHNTLAAWVVRIARRVGVSRVVLSGGVFQNAYLADRTVTLLQEQGFSVATHSHVPPNDGGISLGQAVIAGRLLREREADRCA
jgi:hydrogenase maturation protein HypF